ncbi:MAG: FkbM family methyltransferase [Hyphomicrobiales bacterium]|nr:FkbM family methyltransferase [Hyphomicrobiales bacterium]
MGGDGGGVMDLYSTEYKLPMLGASKSDAFVFNEIYGAGDAYQRERLLKIIERGEVIEIGGHKGYFSVLAGSVARRVVVFEPNELNFSFLKKNIDLNDFNHVTPVRKAVTSTSDIREFTNSSKTDARHSFFQTKFSGLSSKTPVICTTLSDVIIDYSVFNVSLVKMDCEGGEYEILFNLDPAMAQYIPRFVCELHEAPEIPYKKDDLLAHMQSLGYACDVYSSREMNGIKLWMAWFSR